MIINYDKYQLKAIKSEKNTLLIAGAGAGKTTTIIGKINYLIDNGYLESEILCISFTNASVNDLKCKLNNNIDVYTFHKLSMTILDSINYDYSLIMDNLLYLVINNYLDILKNNKKKYRKFKKYVQNENSFIKLVTRFINLYKANNYKEYKFREIFINIKKIKNKQKRLQNYMNLINIINIYKLYNNELHSNNTLDFDDLIITATKKVNESSYINKYKYIIIDEFQDTSQIRLNLILEIYKKNNCKIFCVGDDFQSIYQFTGCNLDIFLNFKKYFKNSKILKLKNTYRNPQELINVAGSFVMKNKKQIKKVLISNKHITKPIKIIYSNNLNILSSLEDYLILGRNNKDIQMYNIYTNKYLTIHKSKGLEADNIVLINLTSNNDGLPSKIKNDYLIDLLLDNPKDVYYEERRLFYVALTRTKNNVYIVLEKHNESEFIKELKKNYKKYIEIIYF